MLFGTGFQPRCELDRTKSSHRLNKQKSDAVAYWTLGHLSVGPHIVMKIVDARLDCLGHRQMFIGKGLFSDGTI